MDIKKLYAICSQGNVLKGIEYIKSFRNRGNDIDKLEKQYAERFISNDEVYEIDSEDPWIIAVISSYYLYFRSVLTNNSIKDSEIKLMEDLSKLVIVNGEISLDKIEMELENIFREKGFSFLGGVTPPYRGPYIWKTTLKKDFNVSLPNSVEKVSVYFISDFLMLSWQHFATFGKHHSGAWAKAEGVYYVDTGNELVDINSTKFQIWFLKHEAQHLSDYKKFPNLDPKNLEYRAKLIEIIYHPNPYELIEKFLLRAYNNKNLPHPYAEYIIIKQLSSLIFNQEYIVDRKQWSSVEAKLLSNVAMELLLHNNKELYEAGSKTEGII